MGQKNLEFYSFFYTTSVTFICAPILIFSNLLTVHALFEESRKLFIGSPSRHSLNILLDLAVGALFQQNAEHFWLAIVY